jgi:hypothetical protein
MQHVAGMAEEGHAPGEADEEEHSLVVAAQVGETGIPTHLDAGPHLDPQPVDDGEITFHHPPR